MSATVRGSSPLRRVGRYTLHGEIASGGMATVYFGKQAGAAGFSRIVAVKRMRAELARDPSFVAMFIDEATIASRVLHPNVVPTLDVVADGAELCIVTEYVRGLSLSALLGLAARREEPVPVGVAAAVLVGVLSGLQAAHEARDKRGQLLGIIHRDVSPHNVLVGVDGVARIMDFGVAKARHRLQSTQEGQLKGKLSYMAPEQIQSPADVDRRVDVFAAAVVLWTALAGKRLFSGSDIADTMTLVLRAEVPPLSDFRSDVPPALEAAVRKALQRDRERRHATARDLALELEAAAPVASAHVVGAWVAALAAEEIASRDAHVAEIENGGVEEPAPAPVPAADADTRVTPAPARSHEESTSSAVTLERLPVAAVAPADARESAAAPAPPDPSAAPPSRPRRVAFVVAAAAVALGAAALWRRAGTDMSPPAVAAAPVPADTGAGPPATPAPDALAAPEPTSSAAAAAAPATSSSVVASSSSSARRGAAARARPREPAARPAAPATPNPASPGGEPGYIPPKP